MRLAGKLIPASALGVWGAACSEGIARWSFITFLSLPMTGNFVLSPAQKQLCHMGPPWAGKEQSMSQDLLTSRRINLVALPKKGQ